MLPYLVGAGALVFFWIVYRILSGTWDVVELTKGDEGFPSASRFQFLLWSGVVFFAYVTLYVARAQHGDFGFIKEIPPNLLILMGISSGTMVISKGITSYHLAHGTTVKHLEVSKRDWLKYLIKDEDENPALNKVQMLVWTLIAVGIYIFLVIREVNTPANPQLGRVLPDVDDAMLVLMGISQGTYLGKKLITTTAPTLQGLDKLSFNLGGEVILLGKNFGDEQMGGEVKIYKIVESKVVEQYPSKITEWKDKTIKFTLPEGLEKGTWNVSVVVGGKDSNQLLTLNVL